jgi:hypothetical protein
MDENVVKELVQTMKGIQERLTAPEAGAIFRGPVADPAPDWGGYPTLPQPWARRIPTIIGPIADPGPEALLDRRRLAQLKVQRLEQAIKSLGSMVESLELERGLLVEEHGLER